jgi:hypothetical protein
MTQSRIVAALGIMSIVLLALFIAGNTYWEDIPIPTPAKGEAITNPFYACLLYTLTLPTNSLV